MTIALQCLIIFHVLVIVGGVTSLFFPVVGHRGDHSIDPGDYQSVAVSEVAAVFAIEGQGVVVVVVIVVQQ